MTLSDLERRNDRHYALSHAKRQLSEPIASNSWKLETDVAVPENYQQLSLVHSSQFIVERLHNNDQCLATLKTET